MTLTVCPTPIGNLDDSTPRQRKALETADLVACEDTRRCGKLMERLGIDRSDGTPRLVTYHEHNADEMAERLVDQLERGAEVTLVCDAGTPGISDPGYRLVRAARQADLDVTALPGPVAALVALSGSGLPTDRFQFCGFVPSSTQKRRDFLTETVESAGTTLFYESPKRVVATLRVLDEVCDPAREVCVARELTKMHEEFVVGRVSEVCDQFAGRDDIKGEIVIVVGPPMTDRNETDRQVNRMIDALLGQDLSSRGIKDAVSETFDVARSGLYDRIERRKQAIDKADEG
jgi:16S rRNA (cytidine1402-2'-O)-methyltransferase